MITRPELVVLDEPTSALDPTARAEIIELLQRIQRERGTAYLFISHDLSTVRFISHRVAVMYLGMIVEQGDAAKVFSQPRHPYSVGLLSSVLLPNPKLKRSPPPSASRARSRARSTCRTAAIWRRAARSSSSAAAARCRRRATSAAAISSTASATRTSRPSTARLDHFAQFQQEAERILGVGPAVPAV